MAERQVVIYRILHRPTGRCYVGSTVNFGTRKREHLRLLRCRKHHSPFLQKAWQDGSEDDFCFEIIESCLESQRVIREQHHIDNLGAEFNYGPVLGSGMPRPTPWMIGNRNGVGNRSRAGQRRGEEERMKVSKALKGRKQSANHRAARSNGMRGNKNGAGKRSAEFKEKMRQANLGRPAPWAAANARRSAAKRAIVPLAKEMDEIERAYLAGLLDTRVGGIYWPRGEESTTIRLVFRTPNKGLVSRIMEMTGTGRPTKVGWEANSDAARSVLRQLLPQLIAKRNLAERALQSG